MFRRRSASQPETEVAEATTSGTPGRTAPKGRPTPTRKQAEAAARAKARAPRTRKERMAAQRQARSVDARKVREAMRTGDERHLLPRDKGPVRRFVRDFVDARFSFLELLLPLALIAAVFSYSGQPNLIQIGSSVMFALLLLGLVEVINIRFRVRRELGQRFPEESTKGTTLYALSRAMQMRFMRLPKPQVKMGQKLADRYR